MLAYLSANPTARLRDVADEVGVTDRTVATIVADLADAGYLTKRRTGFGTATAFARIFDFGTHGTATTLSAS